MTLIINLNDGRQIYERVRTINIDKGSLEYYRDTYYAGVKHIINSSNISTAFIVEYGQTIKLI